MLNRSFTDWLAETEKCNSSDLCSYLDFFLLLHLLLLQMVEDELPGFIHNRKAYDMYDLERLMFDVTDTRLKPSAASDKGSDFGNTGAEDGDQANVPSLPFMSISQRKVSEEPCYPKPHYPNFAYYI